METMAHSDFKCLTRKCLVETMAHYMITLLEPEETYMFN